MFEIDALFLNDDRHLNNIAVIESGGKFGYCPVFDNAAGLLSNVQLMPMDIDPDGLIGTVKARPFLTTFNRQIIHACNLFGRQLRIPRFDEAEIRSELSEPLKFYSERDRGFIAMRVIRTILSGQKESGRILPPV